MSDSGGIYQVRKVFNPKTMGMREELVFSGEVVDEVEAKADPKPAVEKPEPKKTKKPKSRTKRVPRRKKKSDS